MNNTTLKIISGVLLATSGLLGYKVYELRHKVTALEKNQDVYKVCPTFSYDYSKKEPEGLINYEAAQALAENYNKDRGAIPTYNREGKVEIGQDSKSIWFSLERLKNYIWHVEKQGCENNCTDSLGLRICFARYPDLYTYNNSSAEGLNNIPKDYSNRHTVFMVPSYKNASTGVYHDFYPGGKGCTTVAANVPGRYLGEFFVSYISPSIFLPDVSGPNGDSQNHGGLIPPGVSTGSGF